MQTDPHSTGSQGEEAACRYLAGKGYEILERNYRVSQYEIDIVARKGGTVVFCEVKTSRTPVFGPAVTWVTPSKIRHIVLAAREYIAANDITGVPFRFDVIGIDMVNGEILIHHIENAFTVPEDV